MRVQTVSPVGLVDYRRCKLACSFLGSSFSVHRSHYISAVGYVYINTGSVVEPWLYRKRKCDRYFPSAARTALPVSNAVNFAYCHCYRASTHCHVEDMSMR